MIPAGRLLRVAGTTRTPVRVECLAEAVEKVIAVHRAGWKGGSKSEKGWRASFRDHAMPQSGRLYEERSG